MRRSLPSEPLADETPLDRIVAALGDLRARSHQSRYGRAPLPELPSKTATVEIIDALAAALFPRHYGPKELTYERVDVFVADALARALESLRRQVRLELELTGRSQGDSAPSMASDIVARFADELAGSGGAGDRYPGRL